MNRRALLALVGLLAVTLAFVHAQAPPSAARPAAPGSPPRVSQRVGVDMASVDPALFKGLRYRLVGPSRGGRVTTVTGVPSQPRTFYMGVASGGLFRTTDGGNNWTPITDGKVPLGSSGSIAVADSDPKTIYFGTGADGSVIISAAKNINTDVLGSGRSTNPDGIVTAVTASPSANMGSGWCSSYLHRKFNIAFT